MGDWWVFKHSSFLVKSELQNIWKHSNVHQNTENITGIVFYMFQMQNDWKQMKNEQSFQNWQFQSLNFQNLSNLVPRHVFCKISHQRSFWNHKLSYLVLWWKIWKFTILVPVLSKLAKMVLGNFKIWKIKWGSCTIEVWQNWSLWWIWECFTSGPRIITCFKFGPCD